MSTVAVTQHAKMTSMVINPLLSSVTETFETMLSSGVERTGFSIRPRDAQLYDVTAIINVSGPVKGSVAISLSRETALAGVEAFVGDKYAKITPQVCDAVGELANIIVGSAKSKLDMGLNIGLPMIVSDTDYVIAFPIENEPMRVSFSSGLGPLDVDFGFVSRG